MKPSTCTLLCLSAFYFVAILGHVEVAQARNLINVATNRSEDAIQTPKKSRIFIIGGTGTFGRYVVEASVKARHRTVALVRPESMNDSENAALVEKFKRFGVKIVYGDINLNQSVLVKTMKRVDVVISCVGGLQVPDQVNIITAIKKAGNIKRFFPSEYAIDVDRLHDPVEPAKSLFAAKAKIRRQVEAAGIPHTFVVANGFAGRFWPNLAQVNPTTLLPDINKVEAFGDGNSKAIATLEEDVSTYVIKAVDDPRTLNKNLYLKPPANILSFNELFALWEKKSGKILEKTYVSEEELLERIQVAPYGPNILLSVCYSAAIKNDYDSYVIKPSFGVEATKLYPEVKYTTVDEYLNQFLTNDSFSLLSAETEGSSYI